VSIDRGHPENELLIAKDLVSGCPEENRTKNNNLQCIQDATGGKDRRFRSTSSTNIVVGRASSAPPRQKNNNRLTDKPMHSN
jgi:hypothetical protein